MQISAFPAISFIVPLFNHLSESQQMLDSLLGHMPAGLDYEIILSDDASIDGTAEWLSSLKLPRVKGLVSSVNRGYAANNNAAVKVATGDILVLLNSDLLLEPGWLEPMLDLLLLQGDRVGVVGNLQYRIDDGSLDHAGFVINSRGQLEHIAEIFDAQESFNIRKITRLAVTGACMVLRKTDFLACGGFDEQYRNGCEDVDLCFKLRENNLRSCIALNSRVRHHVSLSRGRSSLNDERNSRILFRKWRSLLKQELAAVWLPYIKNGGPYPEDPAALVDPALFESPHLAARLLAEALIVRQENRWQELLGDC